MKFYDTLVLNKLWCPINIIDYKKCMGLIYQDAAFSLDNDFITYDFNSWMQYSMLPKVLDDGYAFINTIKLKIALPDIIVLHKFDRLPYRDIKFSRESVFQRDKFTCQYCGKQFKKIKLEIEHIIPKCQGGKSSWDNVVTSCGVCNDKKGGRTPEQARMKLIAPPKEPAWFSPYTHLKNKPDVRPNWLKYLGKVNLG
jgi:hypothetical protein